MLDRCLGLAFVLLLWGLLLLLVLGLLFGWASFFLRFCSFCCCLFSFATCSMKYVSFHSGKALPSLWTLRMWSCRLKYVLYFLSQSGKKHATSFVPPYGVSGQKMGQGADIGAAIAGVGMLLELLSAVCGVKRRVRARAKLFGFWLLDLGLWTSDLGFWILVEFCFRSSTHRCVGDAAGQAPDFL